MINEVNNNVQNLSFQQQQIVMMGGMVDSKQKKLSPSEIKKMKSDYVAMYFGLVSINWGNGKTLGGAWQKALEQMDGFVMGKAKIANHPMNQELINFHREFRHNMAKSIMTNPNSNIMLSPRLKQDFIDYGTRRVKESKPALDMLYQKYMPDTNQMIKQNPTAQKFNTATLNMQQIMQQMMLQQRMRERAA